MCWEPPGPILQCSGSPRLYLAMPRKPCSTKDNKNHVCFMQRMHVDLCTISLEYITFSSIHLIIVHHLVGFCLLSALQGTLAYTYLSSYSQGVKLLDHRIILSFIFERLSNRFFQCFYHFTFEFTMYESSVFPSPLLQLLISATV